MRDDIYSLLEDLDDEDSIEFSQWTTTDRSNFIHRKETIPNYIDLVEAQLKDLTRHSFIAKNSLHILSPVKNSWDPQEHFFWVTLPKITPSLFRMRSRALIGQISNVRFILQ